MAIGSALLLILASILDLSGASVLKHVPVASDEVSTAYGMSDHAHMNRSHLMPSSNAFLGKDRLHLVAASPQTNGYPLIGIAVFGVAAFALLFWMFMIVEEMYHDFDHASNHIDDVNWTFSDYVSYKFGRWMTWTKDSSTIVVLIVAAFVFLIGTFTYFVLVPRGGGIWHGAWVTYMWMVAPDGGMGERSYAGAACGAVISLCGLLIFALVLTLIDNMFESWMAGLRAGHAPVMEVGHVLIIGLSHPTVHLIGELCEAYARQGGASFVVLSGDVPKQDMEDMVVRANKDLQGSRLTIREGFPQYVHDLEFVAAHACRSVIILADHSKDKEVRDAFVMQTLLVLRTKGWPQHGHILAEYSLQKNKRLMEEIGGHQTNLVMVEQWLAQMYLQVSQQAGLGAIIAGAFSFQGSEMYITDVPACHVGRTLMDIGLYYPLAVVAGTIDADDKTKIGHCDDHVLKQGEELILFCENGDAAALVSSEPFCVPQPVMKGIRKPPKPEFHVPNEKILVVGWGVHIGALLIEIDKHVTQGAHIVVVSPKPIEEREPYLERSQRRWQHNFENITFDHVAGMLGSPTVWERLPFPVWEYHRIFLLGDISMPDARMADACTIASVLHLRGLIGEAPRAKGEPPPRIQIVPEIKDPRSEHLCRICNLTDFLDSAGMPVQVLAALSYQPRLRSVMHSLVGENGPVRFFIRGLEEYLPLHEKVPSHISFVEAQRIVASTGGVLVAWSQPDEEIDSNKFVKELEHEVFHQDQHLESFKWKFNPVDKMYKRAWSIQDRLAVLVDEPSWTFQRTDAPVYHSPRRTGGAAGAWSNKAARTT